MKKADYDKDNDGEIDLPPDKVAGIIAAAKVEMREEIAHSTNHQWDGTKLRFQNPDGTWGDWTELLPDVGDLVQAFQNALI